MIRLEDLKPNAADPIHSEVFDRLYTDWSTLFEISADTRGAASDGGRYSQPVGKRR